MSPLFSCLPNTDTHCFFSCFGLPTSFHSFDTITLVQNNYVSVLIALVSGNFALPSWFSRVMTARWSLCKNRKDVSGLWGHGRWESKWLPKVTKPRPTTGNLYVELAVGQGCFYTIPDLLPTPLCLNRQVYSQPMSFFDRRYLSPHDGNLAIQYLPGGVPGHPRPCSSLPSQFLCLVRASR